jgi:hypothetical protein
MGCLLTWLNEVLCAEQVPRLPQSDRARARAGVDVSGDNSYGGDYKNNFLNTVHGFSSPLVIGFICSAEDGVNCSASAALAPESPFTSPARKPSRAKSSKIA